MEITRRGMLAVAAALTVPTALSACSGDDETPTESEQQLVTVDRAVASPSGDVTAVITELDGELRPAIRDLEGIDVWVDDVAYAEEPFPTVAWATDEDVLWIRSDDQGDASVRQSDDGGWEKVDGSDDMPTEIAELAG